MEDAAADPFELTPEKRALIKKLQGGKVDGLQAIAAVTASGAPSVVRVASLVKGKPFPTLFWLIDPDLIKRISHEEATGMITTFQERVDQSDELRESMAEDHERYIALRDSFMTEDTRQAARERGFDHVLRERGVGGLERRDRIRCLHTWYAAHLVVPNTIGKMLDAHWAAKVEAEELVASAKPVAAQMLLRKTLPLKERFSEAEVRSLQSVRDKATPAETLYYAEDRDLPQQVAEAAELLTLCGPLLEGRCVVDVGCSHGLASYLMLRMHRIDVAERLVWVDTQASCRAARHAEALRVKFCHSQLEAALVPSKALVLVVNLCGEALLRAVSVAREQQAELCVVPCCGPEGVEYDAWVATVREAIGGPTVVTQLRYNLGRVAIVSDGGQQ